MNKDEWEEVVNGELTYTKIAEDLIKGKTVIIGWTDRKYDHRDIMFSYCIKQYGNLQRGLKGYYLFVSIIGHSSMGFLIERKRDNRKHNSYIMEKLKLSDNHCDNAICELVNGVINKIDELDEDLR